MTACRSLGDSSFHVPGSRPSSGKFPILTRRSLSVGKPVAAVMRRTWRFLPSTSVSSSHAVGILARKRTGGSRGGTSGSPGMRRARHGRVR